MTGRDSEDLDEKREERDGLEENQSSATGS